MTRESLKRFEKRMRDKARAILRGLKKKNGQDYQDFMDDCMTQLDEETCQIIWDEMGDE